MSGNSGKISLAIVTEVFPTDTTNLFLIIQCETNQEMSLKYRSKLEKKTRSKSKICAAYENLRSLTKKLTSGNNQIKSAKI